MTVTLEHFKVRFWSSGFYKIVGFALPSPHLPLMQFHSQIQIVACYCYIITGVINSDMVSSNSLIILWLT